MDDEIYSIVGKLAHELEEIRVRALTTILSKLDLGLIPIKDLLENEDIFFNLLNWFKFSTVPCRKDVLLLILRLVKEVDGALGLEIVDPGIRDLTKYVGNDYINELQEIKKCIYEAKNNSGSNSSKELSLRYRSVNSTTEEEIPLSSAVSIFPSSTDAGDSEDFNWDYKPIFWSVPILDESDKRVLTSVGNLLNDLSQCKQAANFFSTVLHDFPPQVFLHDTTILNALFQVYSLKNGEVPEVLVCFKEFTVSLHTQLKFYRDPFASYSESISVNDTSEEHVSVYSKKNPQINEIQTPRQLLGVGEFCGICLERLNDGVPGILKLLQLCIIDLNKFWASTTGNSLKTSISNHLSSLAIRIKTARMGDAVGLLEAQAWTSEVLSQLIPLESASTIVNRNLQAVLSQELFDHNLFIFYPRIHSIFKTYVSTFVYQESNDYDTFEIICNSVRATIKFMKTYKELNVYKALSEFKLSIISLDVHKEYRLINLFFEIIVDKQIAQNEVELAEEIILMLLSHSDAAISIEAYSQVSSVVCKIVGPSSAAKANKDPLVRIPFILNTKVLHEIICFGVTCSQPQIKRDAETILTLLLKSKMAVHIDYWPQILALITSCLPLLTSFASESTSLGRAILSLTDPDIASQFCMHKLHVMSGNARLLFSKVPDVVQESYARLVYLLNLSPLQKFVMPDPSITLPRPPLSTNYFDEDSVMRLADVLDTIVPSDWKMLRSVVLQIGHISEEPSLHIPILETNIITHLRVILRDSVEQLDEDSKELFTAVIIIFKNLAMFNIQLRLDFSLDYELICDVIKGLFMFPQERRMVRDSVQLLALMVYSDFILSTSNGVISLPKVIVDFMFLPFPVNTHLLVSDHVIISKKALLMDRRDACRLIGSVWCCEYAGGAQNFIDTSNHKSLINLQPPLELPPLRTFLSLRLRLTLSLTDLRVANSHQNALKALQSILRYLKLIRWSDDKFEDLDWERSFKRYLTTLPNSLPDQKLLINIIQVLNELIVIVKSQSLWILNIIKDPSHMLCTILTQASVEATTALRKEMSLELLKLVEKCLELSGKNNWQTLAEMLIQSINHSHTQKFYSLAVVDQLLSCFVSTAKHNDTPLKICQDPVWKLLAAFHCPSQTSFMGVAITKRILFALNTINGSFKDSSLPEEVRWIGKLLEARDPLVVSAAIELCSRLGTRPEEMAILLNVLPDLWKTVLRILLDDGHACIVREQAALLCCNIVANSINKNYVSDAVNMKIFKHFNYIYLKHQAGNRPKIEDEKSMCLYKAKSNYYQENEKQERCHTSSKLVSFICTLTVNLMSKDISVILQAAISDSFLQSIARDVTNWQCEKLCEQDTVDMYESALRILVYSCGSSMTNIFVLDSIPTLIWILLPSSYDDDIKNKDIVKENLRLLAIVLVSCDRKKLTTQPQIPSEAVSVLCGAAASKDSGLVLSAAAAITALAPYLTQGASKELVQAMGSRESMRTALASIVANSHSATTVAIEEGLLEENVHRLRGIQLRLAIIPRNTKKASQAMEDLCVELGLITNFLAGSRLAKEQCASLGVADTLHKLWVWCLVDYSLLSTLLRALITFTADSVTAAGTLILTSTLAGVGQRKTPTSSSLLHAILTLLQKDTYPYGIKLLLLEVLKHTCQAPECRGVITKSGYLTEFLYTYSQKKTATVEEAESAWLQLFLVLSSFSDGQSALMKNEEWLEKIINFMCGSRGPRHKPVALAILRNLSFNQANRKRFVLSEKLLKSLCKRLADPDGLKEKEVEDVLLISWALSSNSQRGKGGLRAVGLMSKLGVAMELYYPALLETELAQAVFQIANS